MFAPIPGLVVKEGEETSPDTLRQAGNTRGILIGGGVGGREDSTDEDFETLVMFDYMLAEDEQTDTLWGWTSTLDNIFQVLSGGVVSSEDDSSDGEGVGMFRRQEVEMESNESGDGDQDSAREEDNGLSEAVILDSDEELERIVRDEWEDVSGGSVTDSQPRTRDRKRRRVDGGD
ncbi:hypothetical protein HDV00_006217 [Rhizophlyctis rosea]|nr:hypothetical protein HDV00_006217 [Rhizophlyctis rosea]